MAGRTGATHDFHPQTRQRQTDGTLLYEVKKIIVGQDHLLERLIVALLARGHILRRGRAGAGKDDGDQDSCGGDWRRFQAHPVHARSGPCRPGRHAHLQSEDGEFNTSLGPVFTNLLLADEINRAPAKVQSALLEVMQERQVTIGRETHKRAPSRFWCWPLKIPSKRKGPTRCPKRRWTASCSRCWLATPLPDRRICHRRAHDQPRCKPCRKVLTTDQLVALQKEVDKVYVDPALMEYAVKHGERHAQSRRRWEGDWPIISCLVPVRALRST
jgi:MoxR-like ATPase